jgi:hypothetical protein
MGVYHTFSRGTPSRSLDLTSIRDLPFQRPALNASGEVGRLRDSEVGELDLAGIAQEHVRGGQDAMDDGGALPCASAVCAKSSAAPSACAMYAVSPAPSVSFLRTLSVARCSPR